MTKASNYLENALLNHTFGSTSFTAPPNLYLGLAPSDSGELESGTFTNEMPNANGYSRQAFSARDGDGSAMPTTTSVVENNATISFTASGGDWAAATHFFIADSGTHGAGNVITWGVLATPRTVLDGQRLDFVAGTVQVSLD